MRTKEFLSQRRIDFEAVDILNNDNGRDRLARVGVSSVPVLVKGGRYVFCQNLEDVAEFVGLQGTGHTPLASPVLMVRWTAVLRAGQRYMVQIPGRRLEERAVANRDRSLRLMGHHIFRIGEAFLDTAVQGIEYRVSNANVPPPDGTCVTGREIAAYGEMIIDRLAAWWDGLDDRSGRRDVKTFYGPQPMHQLLERSAWHSAQHVRQLLAVLERFGIEPDGRLTAADLAGLPLPEGLWE